MCHHNYLTCQLTLPCLFVQNSCYDDGCHLRKFANNACRKSLNTTTQRLARTKIVIDRMNFKGHKDSWCRETCDPSKYDELKNVSNVSMYLMILNAHKVTCKFPCPQVDTEICEQVFSWLSRYARITKHMNLDHFMFFILYLCDLHNRKVGVLK